MRSGNRLRASRSNSSSPVVFVVDQTPYTALSSYQFFDGNLKDQIPVQGVLPYKPINTLFSDYSKRNALYGFRQIRRWFIRVLQKFLIFHLAQ